MPRDPKPPRGAKDKSGPRRSRSRGGGGPDRRLQRIEELAKEQLAPRFDGKRRKPYHFQEAHLDGRLVIVDSAGHDEAVTRQLRVGPIVKFRSASPLATVDSFWCLNLRVPVCFAVDPNVPSQLEPIYYPGRIPFIRTPVDNCEKDLAGHKSPCWIDIPLTVCDTIVGKLTCDVELPVHQLAGLHEQVIRLWAAATQAAPYLESLYRAQFDYPLAEVAAELQNLRTSEEVFAYCTTRLTALFQCRYASIFERSRDHFGVNKLVLRHTSFRGKHEGESKLHKAFYDLADDALTAWVGRNNIPLRIHHLEDDRQREQQLAAYRVFDNKLNWRDRHRDSSVHTSFLAVPIPGDLNEVAGVLRFTEKISDTAESSHFNEWDQVLLERIAKEAIGPRLMALGSADAARVPDFSDLEQANALLVERAAPTSQEIARAVLSMLESFFPERNGSQKLYLLNVLEPGRAKFRHHEIGGKLRNDLTQDNVYELDGSLTGYVLNLFRSEGRDASTVFINDFPTAIARKAMIPICGAAQSALACPIVFRDKVYGVIVVKSSCYDLDPEKHGQLIRVVATQAGAMFARREAESLNVLIEQLTAPDCTTPERYVTRWIDDLQGTYRADAGAPSLPRFETLNIRQTVYEAAEAVLQKLPSNIMAKPPNLSVPDVEVSTHRATLAIITYSALRDIYTQQPPEAEHVSVSADLAEEDWLEVSIGPYPHAQQQDEATPANKSERADLLDRVLDNGAGDQLTLSKSVAYYHQGSDGRRGTLSVESSGADAPGRLVVRLPVDSQHSLREDR